MVQRPTFTTTYIS